MKPGAMQICVRSRFETELPDCPHVIQSGRVRFDLVGPWQLDECRPPKRPVVFEGGEGGHAKHEHGVIDDLPTPEVLWQLFVPGPGPATFVRVVQDR